MRLFAWLLMCMVWVLPASAAEVVKLLLPGLVWAEGYNYVAGGTLYCTTVPAEHSVTGATKFAGYVTKGNTNPCGFAIYPNADNGTVLARVSGACALGAMTATGLAPYNIVGGTLYRICTCAQAGGSVAGYLSVAQAVTCCQDHNVTQLIQAFHPTYHGTATNSCANGVPPSTTGAITADTTSPGRNAPQVPLVLIEK